MYQKTSLSVVIYRSFPLIATAGMAGFHHLNFDLLLVTWPLVISELKYYRKVSNIRRTKSQNLNASRLIW